jgi:hypothetical protein
MAATQEQLDQVNTELGQLRAQSTQLQATIEGLENKAHEIRRVLEEQHRVALFTEFDSTDDKERKSEIIVRRLKELWPQDQVVPGPKWIKLYRFGPGRRDLRWAKGVDPNTGGIFHLGKRPRANVFDLVRGQRGLDFL